MMRTVVDGQMQRHDAVAAVDIHEGVVEDGVRIQVHAVPKETVANRDGCVAGAVIKHSYQVGGRIRTAAVCADYRVGDGAGWCDRDTVSRCRHGCPVIGLRTRGLQGDTVSFADVV